ncbi:hypothetical protein Lal_00033334 [Lupinus albus]|nr:hypothetical protein Lal_00033334 [Lupinus albus]
MDMKLRPFCVSALLLLLCLDLQLLYGIEAWPLEVKKLDSSALEIDSKAAPRKSLKTMLKSGPSPGGCGHRGGGPPPSFLK